MGTVPRYIRQELATSEAAKKVVGSVEVEDRSDLGLSVTAATEEKIDKSERFSAARDEKQETTVAERASVVDEPAECDVGREVGAGHETNECVGISESDDSVNTDILAYVEEKEISHLYPHQPPAGWIDVSTSDLVVNPILAILPLLFQGVLSEPKISLGQGMVSTDDGVSKRSEEERVPLRGILKTGGSRARWAVDEPSSSPWGEPIDVGETWFPMWSVELESVATAEVGEEVGLNIITEEETDQGREVGVAEKMAGAQTPSPLGILCEDEQPEVLENVFGVPSADGASRYACPFSDKELDAMDDCEPGQEGAVLAGTEIAVETEEYDKEFEKRLYPLDEVELKKRVDENVKATNNLSIEEISKYLEIPPETLERNRSENAKRANRDFHKSVVSSTVHRADASSKVLDDFGLGEANVVWEVVDRAEVFTSDAVVCANVLVPPKESEVVANAEIETNETENEVVIGAAPWMTKVIACRVVYLLLKETKACRPEPKPPKGRLIVNGGTLEVPLKRDRVPELDWRRVRDRVDQVAKDLGVVGDFMPSVSSWIREYYEKNAGIIWRKLNDRVGVTPTSSAKRRLRRHRPVSTQSTRVDGDNPCVLITPLYKDRAETLGKLGREPMNEDAAENYLQVVRPQRPPPPVRDRKPDLVEVVTVTQPDGFGDRVNEAGDEVREVPRVVDSGRRVVVGSFEALSSGYIDCLPSQMLADTGATLSLISHRVLKRLVVGLDLLVADQLHVDAILGVDALGAFGDVIDVAERNITLKGSGDVLLLGVMVVHETFMTTMEPPFDSLPGVKRWMS
ncbi:unnamed protein product [Phytophthora fragariaefolia]|uniref:Unnamed protein product n=1 Tax=Phytophthora fragariaefolia TaxID=1490495 RepID=A0A9W6X1B2_9STRA|nr:unnamed protein product [Phytophthora fragariaefolia]